MTIDELARESGMTARNIRAHQSRGLLPPPDVRARTGYYGAEHLARIRLIQDMQAQGFNLKSIERLLEMGARSGSRETLEFQRAILEPFGSEEPEVIDDDRDRSDLRRPARPEADRQGREDRLLNPIGERDLGGPLADAAARRPRPDRARDPARPRDRRRRRDQQAHDGDREGVRPALRQGRPGADPERSGQPRSLAAAGEAVERLRPLASQAVMASFGVVMTQAVERQLERELGR